MVCDFYDRAITLDGLVLSMLNGKGKQARTHGVILGPQVHSHAGGTQMAVIYVER